MSNERTARPSRRQRSRFWPLEPVQIPSPVAAVPPQQARVVRQLHALAEAASGYLRFHPDRSVRRAIALLAAATLAASAACGPSTDTVAPPQSAVVEKAAPQANAGFPTAAGTYELRPGSIQMDTGGTYYLWWYTSGTGGALNVARGANVKLVEDDRSYLEIVSGDAPILHLKNQEPVALVAAGNAGQPQAVPTPTGEQRANSGGGFGASPWMWYPFLLGGIGGRSNTVIIERDRPVDPGVTRTPGYYSPPHTDIEPGSEVRGGVRTSTPPSSAPSFQLKTTSVSGRAGGTGSGTAATGKAGGDSSSSRIGAPRSGGFSSGSGSSLSGSSAS